MLFQPYLRPKDRIESNYVNQNCADLYRIYLVEALYLYRIYLVHVDKSANYIIYANT